MMRRTIIDGCYVKYCDGLSNGYKKQQRGYKREQQGYTNEQSYKCER